MYNLPPLDPLIGEDNSQTYSNSDPTAGNGNSTSMKELAPEGLDDRR